MIANEIKSLLNDPYKREYAYYGIRVEVDVDYAIGEIAHQSHVWADDDATDQMLDGTSCVGIMYASDVDNALIVSKSYGWGDKRKTYLIAGDRMQYGDDDYEYVIPDAVVIGTISIRR